MVNDIRRQTYDTIVRSIDSAIDSLNTHDLADAFGFIATAEEKLGEYRALTGGDGTEYREAVRLEETEERFLREAGLDE